MSNQQTRFTFATDIDFVFIKQCMAHSSTSYARIFAYCLFIIFSLESTYTSAEIRYLPENVADLSINQREKVGDGLSDALTSRLAATTETPGYHPEGVRVVVMLQSPGLRSTALGNVAGRRNEIARLQQAISETLESHDFETINRFKAIPAMVGVVKNESALARLAANPNVIMIDEDIGGTGHLDDSVTLIDADQRHLYGNEGSGVVVAVLDSGVDTDNSDLAVSIIHQECFLDFDGSINGVGLCPSGSDRQSGAGAAEDDAGHGTHVTGIVTSNGVITPGPGVAPSANIISIKVLAGPTFRGVFQYFSEVLAALDFVINNPQMNIRVINMSLGTSALYNGDCDSSTSFNAAGASAINTLRANGVIAFASSGNNGSGTQMTSPACISNVVSVGSSNSSGFMSAFTNSNSSLDIVAPGAGIKSSGIGDTVKNASGTSMASPHAAGCAALLIESGDASTPDMIETRLESSQVLVTNPLNGLSFPHIDCGLDDFDVDGDGILDTDDNCILHDNPEQLDTDGDGYGNLCDGDLNNDSSTNTLDLDLYKQSHRSAIGDANYNADADFNGDGVINTLDLNIYMGLHRLPPGPSCCVS